MSKVLVLLSAVLGVSYADYNPWAPVDATVTEVVSRTAYVCPCDDSTSYGSDWNVWESTMLDLTYTAATTKSSNMYSTSDISTEPSVYSTVCYTSMGTAPAPYSTFYSISYTDCASTITSTVSTTVTLSAITSTALITTTATATQSASTQTSTMTSIQTSTVTATVTTVIGTSTVTATSTSTSSIPAPSGLVPIRSSLPGSSYNGTGGANPIAKRHVGSIRVGRSNQLATNGTSPFLGYPNGVTCVTASATQCSSVVTTITSTQTVSPSTCVTSTVTTTTTINASATTTTTATATTLVTVSTFVSITSTTTTTTIIPGPTVYAACASNNLADTVNGQIIGDIYQVQGLNANYVSVSSAYECCALGSLMNNAGATVFFASLSINNCLIDLRHSCPSGQSSTLYQAVTGDQGNGQASISNQNCGMFNGVRS